MKERKGVRIKPLWTCLNSCLQTMISIKNQPLKTLILSQSKSTRRSSKRKSRWLAWKLIVYKWMIMVLAVNKSVWAQSQIQKIESATMNPQQTLRNLSWFESNLSSGQNRGLLWLAGGHRTKSTALNSSALQKPIVAYKVSNTLLGATFFDEIYDRQARQALQSMQIAIKPRKITRDVISTKPYWKLALKNLHANSTMSTLGLRWMHLQMHKVLQKLPKLTLSNQQIK